MSVIVLVLAIIVLALKESEWRGEERDNAKREQGYKDLMHELNQLRKQIEKLNKE